MNTPENLWYAVARADDLPPRHIFHGQLHGVELALWRADDDRVNAWENRCPHRSVRFTLGVNTGERLRCQYHGWQYRSGDGRCAIIPASSQIAPPAGLCARPFAIEEAHGYIWVNLSDDPAYTAAIPEPEFAPLAVALRSLTINASLDAVAAALPHYADYDETATAGRRTCRQSGDGIDLSWGAASGESQVRFWLQPASQTRTIVHGSANLAGMSDAQVLRLHNRWLNALRRRLESHETAGPIPTLAEPASASAPASRVIPIVPIMPFRSAAQSGKTWFQATVTERWTTAEDIVAFRLALPDGAHVEFNAGAHIDVQTPAGLVRQYSLVNAPDERDQLVIGVKREAASRGGSRSLHDSLRIGDALTVSAPKDHFKLVPGEGGVLIAGGIGITPILAMGLALHHAGLPYRLHYLARSAAHVAFEDRLGKLSGLQLHTGLTADGSREAVDEALHKAPPASHVYVCGPRPLVDLVRERAAAIGMAEAHVHAELFANEVSHDTDQPFRVRLQRSGVEFVVPVGVSLADALKARDIAIDTSCEQGVCGTCRIAVVDGEPEHRDVYLTDDEKQSRRCLMPCVSRSRSNLMVLDL